MEWPLLEEGDRRFRIDNDKYIKNLAELSAEVHKYGVPHLHPALPPRPLERHLRPHRRAGGRVGGDLPLAVRRARREAAARAHHRRDRGAGRPVRLGHRPSAAGRLGRHRDQRRRRPPVPRLPVPLLEQARRQVRPAEHGEPHPLHRRRHQGDQEALRPGLPGADPHERHRGRAARRRGPQHRGGQADRPHLRVGRRRLAPRALALGGHAPGLVQPGEHVLSRAPHPAQGLPQGAGLEPPRRAGPGAAGADHQVGGQDPGHDGGSHRRRLGRRDPPRRARPTSSASTAASSPTTTGPTRSARAGSEDIQPCTHCGTCNTNYNEARYCRINACFGTE